MQCPLRGWLLIACPGNVQCFPDSRADVGCVPLGLNSRLGPILTIVRVRNRGGFRDVCRMKAFEGRTCPYIPLGFGCT
jgi:hypothetical protein